MVILGLEKVVEDGIERYNEDKKLSVNNLKYTHPEFSEQNIKNHYSKRKRNSL